MNELDRIYDQSGSAATFAEGYVAYLCTVLQKIDPQEIAAFAEILLEARAKDRRIFFIGNGGSAATASHFANDLSIGPRAWDKPFRAISLTDNVAILSAVANDESYELVFTRQLQIAMTPDDIVVAISASGNSPNVLHAVAYANQKGAMTVGLTAFDGGKLRKLCRHAVHIPTHPGEYGPAEDGHMVLDHLLGAFLMRAIRDK